MMNILSVILLNLTSYAFAETQEFERSSISRLEFRNTSGNLVLASVDQGKCIVEINKKKFSDHCQLIVEQRGATLYIEVKQTKIVEECHIDFKIKSPKNISGNFKIGSGDLTIKGTSGDLNFSIGSGSLDVNAEVKELDGHVGSGSVAIIGLTSGGHLKVGSGRSHLIYNRVPLRGDLNVISGSGDVDITLPKSSKVRTSFKRGHGELINELGDTAGSEFLISGTVGSGDLHIKKN